MKTAFATAPYLGTDEEVELRVGRGGGSQVEADFDGVNRTVVTVTMLGGELLDDLVHECIMAMHASYADKLGMEPSEPLEDAWEAALRKCWARVI